MPLNPLTAPPVQQLDTSQVGTALSNLATNLRRGRESDQRMKLVEEQAGWQRVDRARQEARRQASAGWKMGGGLEDPAQQEILDRISQEDPEYARQLAREELSFMALGQGVEKGALDLKSAEIDSHLKDIGVMKMVFEGATKEDWPQRLKTYEGVIPESERAARLENIPKEWPGEDEVRRLAIQVDVTKDRLEREAARRKIEAHDAKMAESGAKVKKMGAETALAYDKGEFYRKGGRGGQGGKPPTPQDAYKRISEVEQRWADFLTKKTVDPMAQMFAESMGLDLKVGEEISKETQDRLRASYDEEVAYLRQYAPRREGIDDPGALRKMLDVDVTPAASSSRGGTPSSAPVTALGPQRGTTVLQDAVGSRAPAQPAPAPAPAQTALQPQTGGPAPVSATHPPTTALPQAATQVAPAAPPATGPAPEGQAFPSVYDNRAALPETGADKTARLREEKRQTALETSRREDAKRQDRDNQAKAVVADAVQVAVASKGEPPEAIAEKLAEVARQNGVSIAKLAQSMWSDSDGMRMFANPKKYEKVYLALMALAKGTPAEPRTALAQK